MNERRTLGLMAAFSIFPALFLAGCYAVVPMAGFGLANVAGFSAGKIASGANSPGNVAASSASSSVPAESNASPLAQREARGIKIQILELAGPTKQMPALEVRFSIKNANTSEIVVERIEGIDKRGVFVEQVDESEFSRLLYEGMQNSMSASSNSSNSTDAYAKITGMGIATTLLGAFVPGLGGGAMMGYMAGEGEKQAREVQRIQEGMRATLEGFKQRQAKTIEFAPGGTCLASAFFSSHVTLSAIVFTIGGGEKTRVKIPLG